MSTTLINCGPHLGDKINATLLGQKGRHTLIWDACVICGKERWVATNRGMPAYQRCVDCARQWVHRYCKGQPRKTRNGGKYKSDGYIWLLCKMSSPYFSMANQNGYVAEHRLVIAEQLHRPLRHYEIVHHKNHIRDDNRPENLSLLSGKTEHLVDLKLYEYIEQLEKKNQELRRELEWLQPF